jgi:hypothetical protein
MVERGWTGSNAYQMNGSVKDRTGVIKYVLKGKWDSQMIAIKKETN